MISALIITELARSASAMSGVLLIVASASAAQVPRFEVDAAWPKELPNNWILGQVAGVAVDKENHVWVLQRPRTLTDDERGAALEPPVSKCCFPAPPVLEFDQEGNLLRGWGGPGAGYEWPRNEHGLSIDEDGMVWIGGNDKTDHQVLKFTPDGEFLMQIGHADQTGGSNNTTLLGRPALAILDKSANELYVADGYGNKRVIVFSAADGGYKRHWGADGHRPDDADTGAYDPAAPRSEQFRNPVHCVRISNDGLVYVCDRTNNRLQVFRKDGSFVTEFIVEPATRGIGSVWDLAFSEDAGQKFLYIADGRNNEVHILLREDGRKIGSFGHAGRGAGQFHWIHNIAVDSHGNVYLSEVDTGKRVHKFRRID